MMPRFRIFDKGGLYGVDRRFLWWWLACGDGRRVEFESVEDAKAWIRRNYGPRIEVGKAIK